jgi:hypothetical protein
MVFAIVANQSAPDAQSADFTERSEKVKAAAIPQGNVLPSGKNLFHQVTSNASSVT